MLPILQIGSISIQTQGLLILAGLIAAELSVERIARRLGITPDHFSNMVWIGLVTAAAAARTGYVLQNLESFQNNWLSLISPNLNLMNWEIGILFAFITAAIYAQKNRLLLWRVLDCIGIAISVFTPFFWLSQLAAGSAFGTPTSLPWGIYLWGQTRHPLQLYYVFSSLVAILMIWPFGRMESIKSPLFAGGRFLIFVSFTSLYVLLLDVLRGDAVTLTNGWHTLQIAAWLCFTISSILYWKMNSSQRNS